MGVYPNPSEGQFNLYIENEIQMNYTITVSDVLGKIISTQIIAVSGNENSTIDLRQQPAGIYFLNVATQDTQKVMKLIRE